MSASQPVGTPADAARCPVDHSAPAFAEVSAAPMRLLPPMGLASLPRPPGRLPYFGDLFKFSLKSPVMDTVKMGRGLGPIFSRKILNRHAVMVASADLLGEICDESRYAKHLVPAVSMLRSGVGDGLFTAYDGEPNWRKAHNVLAPAFTQGAMRQYHDTMVELSTKFVQRWDAISGTGTAVDVTRDTTRLTLETIAITGFGYSFSAFDQEDEHPFVAAMIRTLRFARRSAMRLPFTMGWFGRHAIAQQGLDEEYLAHEVDEVIARRVAERDTSTNDLLGLMLNSLDPETGERLDDTNIRYQILTFLVAGHETTSGALSFALYYLAKHPEVFTQARTEVDAVWGDDLDSTPSYEQIAKLRYLRRVLDESLRLWPTAPGFARKSRVDQYLGGHPIKKDEWVIAVLPLIHRDPEVWENPEEFDPDRFLPEHVRARPGHAYKPWGIGDRACIGRQFAIHEALLVLGRIVQRFDLHDTFDYELELVEALTIKPAGFNLTLTSRAAHSAALKE